MSSRPRLEVADVVRQHAAPYLMRYGASAAQRRVLRAIVRCRTAALGGHIAECDQCRYRRIAYNSCRNRHCPKCQGSATTRWLQQRAAELLPVPYFHVVFTLPDTLRPLALQNPRQLYTGLFQAAAETLLEVAAHPQRGSVRIGFLAVLHTWGQNLLHHPHLHCVVPAGGLSADGLLWIPGRANYLLPTRVLSRVFRGKFMSWLRQARERGELQFHGRLYGLTAAGAWQHLLRRAVRREWVVYAKAPFGGPAQVLRYLARYTHRVAISNRRLVRLKDGKVTFRYRDYGDRQRHKLMTLEGEEFLRRFLMHVLPKGFVRIRHYGYMANRGRSANLERCRRLLAPAYPSAPGERPVLLPSQTTGPDSGPAPMVEVCPMCRSGTMQCVEFFTSLLAEGSLQPAGPGIEYRDTS